MDHAALVEALRDPAFYPHPAGEVELVQTHISSVLLTGDVAYKLKKPVNFGFLDFSTVELRGRYCRAEVELNRRLAPSVYRGVVPITDDGGRLALGGPGEVVDWLVQMRQMDGRLLGPEVLSRGELDEGRVDRLVDLLVPFYREAATGAGVDELGTVDAIRVNTDENFAQTEPFVGSALSRRRFEEISDFTNRFLAEQECLVERRIEEGRVRECHGDLHLGNIVFEEPPVIFDCIEFNRRFRCSDVAFDLGFLVMDLEFRGRPELARRLVARYVERSGDRELPELLPLTCCYRAYVRGKIACFTAADPGLGDELRDQQLGLARRYFGLAHRYAGGTSRPAVVVLYGLMGTGKTTLARYLEASLGWPVLSTDAVRKQLAGIGETTKVRVPYNQGLYAPEMSRRTYVEVCRRAKELCAAGETVVVDGAFKVNDERDQVLTMAHEAGVQVVFVNTVCSLEEQRRRLEVRQRRPDVSDGRPELILDQRRDFQPPRPARAHLFEDLDTNGSVEETRAGLHALLERRGVTG